VLGLVLVVVLRPRKSRCITIRITEQNYCGTIWALFAGENADGSRTKDEDENEDEPIDRGKMSGRVYSNYAGR
jgi:hypothetical protein